MRDSLGDHMYCCYTTTTVLHSHAHTQIHTHILWNGLPPSHTPSRLHPNSTHSPSHTPSPWRVRNRHSLAYNVNFPVNLMFWVSVEGTTGRGAWCHCHFSDWLRSDMTCVTVAQPTPNSTGLYGREKSLRWHMKSISILYSMRSIAVSACLEWWQLSSLISLLPPSGYTWEWARTPQHSASSAHACVHVTYRGGM